MQILKKDLHETSPHIFQELVLLNSNKCGSQPQTDFKNGECIPSKTPMKAVDSPTSSFTHLHFQEQLWKYIPYYYYNSNYLKTTMIQEENR